MIRLPSIPRLQILSGLLLAVSITGRSWADHDEVRALRQAGAIVPLEQIIQQTSVRYPGRLLEAELEEEHGRLIYEIEWLDDTGTVRELRFDAPAGEPICVAQVDEKDCRYVR